MKILRGIFLLFQSVCEKPKNEPLHLQNLPMPLTSKAFELTVHQKCTSRITFCLAVQVGWEAVSRPELCSKGNTSPALHFTYYMDVKNLARQFVAICIHHIKGEGEVSAGISFPVAVHHVPCREGQQKRDLYYRLQQLILRLEAAWHHQLRHLGLDRAPGLGFHYFLCSFSPAERDFLTYV